MKPINDPPQFSEKEFKKLLFKLIKGNTLAANFKHHNNNVLTAINGNSIGMRYHVESFKDKISGTPIYYDFYKIALYKGIDKSGLAMAKLFGGPAMTLVESFLNPVDLAGLEAGTDALSSINEVLNSAGDLEGNIKPKLGNVGQQFREEGFRIQKKAAGADQFEVACNFANVWKFQLTKVVGNGLRGDKFVHINTDVASRLTTNSLYDHLIKGADLGGFNSFTYDISNRIYC